MAKDLVELKRRAARAAVAHVESGMVVGLGGGSTALEAIVQMGTLLAGGELWDIVGVPCSEQVAADARRHGVPLSTLEDHPVVDLTIDGADEVDPQLHLIKGGGGALLREKIVAQATRREIIIVDETKLSPRLGTRWPVPVEVLPFGWRTHLAFLRDLGAQDVAVRAGRDGLPLRTDSGNRILDCHFGPIDDVEGLADALSRRAGVVEHGLFIGLTSDLIVAGAEGIQRRQR